MDLKLAAQFKAWNNLGPGENLYANALVGSGTQSDTLGQFLPCLHDYCAPDTGGRITEEVILSTLLYSVQCMVLWVGSHDEESRGAAFWPIPVVDAEAVLLTASGIQLRSTAAYRTSHRFVRRPAFRPTTSVDG